MDLEIAEVDASRLVEYAAVPSTYRVTQRLVRLPSTSHVLESLSVESVATPYDKDYDAPPGMPPMSWSTHFDLRPWGLLIARRSGRAIGAAAIAPSIAVMPEVQWTEPTTVLWDLRVAPEHRREGIGAALFRAAERWALRNAYGAIAVETQDVNVTAARFYEAMGCALLSFEPSAYPDVPGEARLVYGRPLREE
jgi:ribosomal protein S18 acetylase RimI-like enzyme